jgi:hypothetical protein
MTYADFLTRVIEDGRDAAKGDYREPRDRHKLQGSLHGFEDCRGLAPAQLSLLYDIATQDAERRRDGPLNTYWYYRCRAAEIEWVLNCVSAALVNEGGPPIRAWMPTARAMMKAAEILNGETRA